MGTKQTCPKERFNQIAVPYLICLTLKKIMPYFDLFLSEQIFFNYITNEIEVSNSVVLFL